MSFGSGSTTNLPQPEQKPLGLDEKRLATHEQARPVPVVYGRQRVGVTFLSQAFNQSAEAVTQEVGKKQDPITVGYNYRCDFAALVCQGPTDGIHAIYFDDEMVWPATGDGELRQGADDSIEITIPNFGKWDWYWGTETQGIDPLLATLDPATEPNVDEQHPAYRSQSYFVAKQQFLGYQKTNIQNIEVVVSRHPAVSWLTPGSAIGNDVNSMAAIADMVTNKRYGLGLVDTDSSNTALARATIDATALQLDNEGLGISPVINRNQPFRQILIELLEYLGAYYFTNASGQLSIGLVRQIPCGDPAVPVLDENAMIEVPQLQVDGLSKTVNDVRLGFTNAQNEYKEDAVTGLNLANLQMTGEPSPAVLKRPWITSPDIAHRQAVAAAATLGLPRSRGRLRIRKSKLSTLGVGSGFKLHYSHWNLCWLDCRVQEIGVQNPYKAEVEIAFEVDRGYLSAEAYITDPPTYTAPEKIVHEVPALDHRRIIETPYSKADEGLAPMLLFLVARPQAMVQQFTAHRKNPDDSFKQVRTFERFARHGNLDADYSASASGTISVTMDSADSSLADITADATEQAQDKWLLIIGAVDHTIEANGLVPAVTFSAEEIMSIQTPTLVTGSQYTLTVARARFDTKKLAHTSGASLFIISQAQLQALALRPTEDVGIGTTHTYKLQPIILGGPRDLSLVPEDAVVLSDRIRRPFRPLGISVPSNYSTGQNIFIQWAANRRETPSVRANTWPGPTWIIEIRKTTDTSSAYTQYPAASTRHQHPLDYERLNHTIVNSDLQSYLGSEVSFIVRIYAREGLYVSRHFEEFTVTKV